MNNREIFKDNLNYYLNKFGKLQKELAEYVGAKTTTVSGWTRGISYPRADAMEKIAMFFGIKTSQLVGKRHDDEPEITPQTIEARIVSGGMDKLPKDQRELILGMLRTMYSNQPELFKQRKDDADDKDT